MAVFESQKWGEMQAVSMQVAGQLTRRIITVIPASNGFDYFKGEIMYYSDNNRLTRRFMLSATGAMLGICLTGRNALAGGGGGGRDPEPASESSSNTTIEIGDKPRTKTRVLLTQKNYHKTSTKGLKTAIAGNKAGDEYRIEGFSKKMSQKIFEMTLLDRKYMLKLLKDMSKLKTKKARLKKLRTADRWQRVYINEFDDDIKPKTAAEIFGNDNKEEIDRLKAKRKISRAFRRFLKTWMNNPMEGRLPEG